jgi:hypothetical protein
MHADRGGGNYSYRQLNLIGLHEPNFEVETGKCDLVIFQMPKYFNQIPSHATV